VNRRRLSLVCLSLVIGLSSLTGLIGCAGSGKASTPTAPLAITNTSLSGATINSPYSQFLSASGGTGSGQVWTLASGTLPAGVTLSSTGVVAGTPTAAGTFSPKIQVTDSGSNTASTTFSLVVAYPTLGIVTSSLPSGTVGFSYSATMSAGGGSGTGYTYAVISGTALSAAGLTLSSSGVISGTPTTAESAAAVTIQVTDSAGNTASTQLTVTIYTAIAITTTSLSAGTQGTAYSVTLAASGGAGGFTWSLATGALPTGITLSGAGVLSGTPTQAGSFAITIQVKDSANNIKTAPFTLVINSACTHDGSGNSILNGNYAFLLAGYDPNGSAYDIIGDFKADGAGNISSGNADANGVSFAASSKLEQNYTFSGTYSIGSTDDRGTANWTNSSTSTTGLPATSTYCFAADTVTSGVAYSGRIIEADGSGFMLTGFFQIQNPSNFNNAALSSGYAFGVQGFTPGGTPPSRTALIGQVAMNGSGSVTSGILDIASYNGTTQSAQYTPQVPVTTASSNYSIAANGRGTLTIATGSGNITFVVYVVGTGNKLLLLSNTASSYGTPLLAGQAIQQTQTSFTASSLNGGAVYREIRTTAPSTPPIYDDVRVGQYSFNGSGGVNETRDENSGGVLTLDATASGTYTVSSSGYVSIAGLNSHPPNFYLYAPNAGFGLDASSGIGFYTMLAQNPPSGGFTNATLTGDFSFGTIFPTAYNASSTYPQVLTGTAVFSGVSAVTITEDEVIAPGLAANISAGQTVSDTYVLGTGSLATTGRFLINQQGTPTVVGYMVSSSQIFLIQITSGQDGLSLEADHQ